MSAKKIDRGATKDAPQGVLQGTTLQFSLPAGTDNAL
jgi:hypothetical protein